MAGTKPGFPGPYVNEVPSEGSDKLMEYTRLQDMGIGARPSTLKTVEQSGPNGLDHVGGSAGKK